MNMRKLFTNLATTGTRLIIFASMLMTALMSNVTPAFAAPRVGSVSVGTQTGALTSGTSGSATFIVTVSRGSQTGGFTADLSIISVLPSGATASFNPVSLSFSGNQSSATSTLTINITTSTPAGATSFTVQALRSGGPSPDFATGNGTLTIDPAVVLSTPTITFDPAPTPTYPGSDFMVSATTNSDGALTYSAVSGPCSVVDGSLGTFSPTGVGTCVVQADTAETATYAAGSEQQSIDITAATVLLTPTITFDPTPTPTYPGSDFSVSATTNSDGALTYSAVSGPCSVVDGSLGTFSPTGVGTCVVQADTAETATYAAGSEQQSVSIISAAAPGIDLCATTGSISVPGGTVPVLGYALGDCSDNPSASVPGPVLTFNQGDSVSITLHNNLTETTALLFQGQSIIPDLTGTASGDSKTYSFTATNAGTFLYEAGLMPNEQHQVAMGMYGALIVRPATAGQAYDDASTAYDREEVMVLSEVDPALNNSGSPSTFDMRNYSPQYFLINGKAFPGTDPIAGNPGEKVLLRFVNAGLQAHSMSTLGFSQTIIAQDGEPYTYSHNVIAETIATGQTLDTIITVPATAIEGDQFAVYDANMLLHNTNAAGFGGMMTFLTVGSGTPPPPPDAGPMVIGLSLSPNPTNGSLDVTVSATVTDDSSTIQAAEFYIDGTANPSNAMAASDGTFDGNPESVTGTISIATLGTLSSGNHTIYVRGQDTNGNWGPFLSIILTLDKTGPVTRNLGLNPNPSDGSMQITLTATGDDTATGGSNVTAAEYWVDTAPSTAMSIVAGADAPIRNFTATIPAGLSQGSHVVSVRSQDAFGNWGAVATINLMIGDTAAPTTSNIVADPNPTNGLTGYNTSVPAVRVFADFSDAATGGSNIVAAEGFIDMVGATGTGFVFIASDGGFNSPTESGYADLPLASVRALSSGDHTIYVHAKDAAGNWGDANIATAILTVDKTGPTFGSITVTPPDADRQNNATVNVAIAGSVTDNISGVDTNSGSYTITDSKSSDVVTETFSIDGSGNFSFNVDISTSNNGNPSNHRYYTFTISVADNLGNVGTATVQFVVQ